MNIRKKESRASRRGAFSAGAAALAVAVVVAFNLLVAQIPTRYTQLDLSPNNIYRITDTSVEYMAALSEDVSIHVLANKDAMDQRIVRFLDQYKELSDRLSVEYTNPTTYPSVLSAYGAEANTIVVACEATGRQETIAIDDLIEYDIYTYMMSGERNETAFDCEGQLTSAVDLVVSESSRRAYAINDHAEQSLSASVEDLMKKSHFSVEEVNVLMDGVPEDCDLLICNGPASDLADDEAELILSYLSGGGQLIYLMGADLTEMPNWNRVLSQYGISPTTGLIADTQRYYQNNPYVIFPEIDLTVDAAHSLTGDSTVLLFSSRGMTLTDPARDTIAVSSFLTTSDHGVNVVDDSDQTEGTYVLGAVATEETGGGTARLTVFGCSNMISGQITGSFTNIANLDLFMNAATVGFDDITNLSIEPVSLQVSSNTITTGGIWSVLFVFVVPLAVVAVGFVHWMRRRKL
ncbi:GldG family protein [Oscillibacter sp. MSJ-2]|uniref:GldG family protein n=1 Tax=Dysosmobacter acutus TaxID=2841504 RepID=A0ABS6F6B2_9FIRM|nr:Gldg family protein [Dysosmobacter acutus]MBU5625603.1 GldG family protein [Dysosmobacter acutus]